jgi:zinc transporter
MRISIADSDDRGLIWGFRLEPFEPCGCEVLDSDSHGAGTWLHFNLTDSRARRWLEHAEMPAAARTLLLEPETRAHVQIHPGGLSLVVSDMQQDFTARSAQDPATFATLRMYLDADRILTGRHRPLEAMRAVHHELVATAEQSSPVEVLARILERLATAFADRVRHYGDALDTAEDDILGGQYLAHGPMLSRGRRAMARLRRHLMADLGALQIVPDAIASWCDAESCQRIRQAVLRFGTVAQEIDFVQERSRMLQDEINNHLNETTNRNLYLLSVVTTAALPATLVTGIFGMNVGGLPLSDSRSGFFWVLTGTLLLMAAVMFSLIRRSRP